MDRVPRLAAQLALLLVLLCGQAAAFWRMNCPGNIMFERADPLVFPGEVSPHMHVFAGSSNADYNVTRESLLASDCTSCVVTQDHSLYWVPTLYFHDTSNDSFTAVDQTGGLLIYYLQRANDGEEILAFPDGFRMIAGDMLKRSYDNSTSAASFITFHCLDYATNSDLPETHNLPDVNCANGVRQQVFFPSCWDGVNLDSSDHKSHVAYPSGAGAGTCPESHPKRLISLFYESIWDTNAFKDMWTEGDQQPFVFSYGDPTGYGSHGDFINGWESGVLQKAVDNCTSDSGVIEDCSVFDLQSINEAAACKRQTDTARPNDQLTGNMERLPGNNPLQWGPEDASILPWDSVISETPTSSASVSTRSQHTSSQSPSPSASTTALSSAPRAVSTTAASTTSPLSTSSSTSPLSTSSSTTPLATSTTLSHTTTSASTAAYTLPLPLAFSEKLVTLGAAVSTTLVPITVRTTIADAAVTAA